MAVKYEEKAIHGIGQFEDWANDLEFFALWGEVEYDENDEEVGDEWIEWVAAAACKTEEVAKLVCEGYTDEWTKVKVGTRYDIDFGDFLDKMREDGCVAVFDGDDPELPVAITFGSGKTIAQHLEEQGKVPVLEVPCEDGDEEYETYDELEFDEFVIWVDEMSHSVLTQDEAGAWHTVATCRTEEAADMVRGHLAEQGLAAKVSTSDSFGRDAFLCSLQEGECLAIFDAEVDGDGDIVPLDDDERPLVVTTMGPAPIVRLIRGNGDEAYVVSFVDISTLMFSLNMHFEAADFDRWATKLPLVVTAPDGKTVATCMEGGAADAIAAAEEGRSVRDDVPFDAAGRPQFAVFAMDGTGWLSRSTSVPDAIATYPLDAVRFAEHIEREGKGVAIEVFPPLPVSQAALARNGDILTRDE